MRQLLLLIVAIVLIAPIAAANHFSTDFPRTEFPISEGGGRWLGGSSIGLDWSDEGTTGGHTYSAILPGTDTDGTAILTGTWGPTQVVTQRVFTANGAGSEIEARLRSTMTAHSSTGYEVTWVVNSGRGSYVGIARWNGPIANFASLALKKGRQYAVNNGDIVIATIVGNTISGYTCPSGSNCVLRVQATDNTYTTGSPGMGMDMPAGTNTGIGVSCFSASDDGSFSGASCSSADVQSTIKAAVATNWTNPAVSAGTWKWRSALIVLLLGLLIGLSVVYLTACFRKKAKNPKKGGHEHVA
jgi:hypothetical protein